MSAQVIQIDTREEDQTSIGASPPRHRLASARENHQLDVSDVESPRPGLELTVKQLYSELSGDSRFLKALHVIEEAISCLAKALAFDPSGEFVFFDQQLITARALLLTAFRYRDIGDGYAAIVNASVWAIANRGVTSISKRQINVLIGALERVSNGPLLHFDTAMQVLDELEVADLEIDPPTLDLLTDESDD